MIFVKAFLGVIMIKRFLCWLGLHKWITPNVVHIDVKKGLFKKSFCKHCGKVKSRRILW
jgi:hypothetical protein